MSSNHLKHKAFLSWAKKQGGNCCVCRSLKGEFKPGNELHHFDWVNRGTGVKGRDHWICHLCTPCHKSLQGKGRMWFIMNNKLETYTAMVEDALNTLSDYVLKHKQPEGKTDDVF